MLSTMPSDDMPKTWRELRQDLARLGARPVRSKGSHEVWQFDDGSTFVAIINHPSDGVPKGYAKKYLTLRKRQMVRKAP